MKTSKYLEELKTQSAEQLNEQLVEAKKELLKGLFMRYSSLINNRSGQEKDMVMKNIDVILDWYNTLLKQKEE